MLIATSPRLCSDQEKNSNEEVDSPIEVDCMSSKCISNNCVGERGELMNEERSWLVQSAQPAYEFMTDTITTKPPREIIDPQKTKDISKHSVKSKLLQLDQPSVSQQAREIEGEEFLDYLEPAKAPSEEPHGSLKTDVQSELGNLLQSATVKSDESPLIAPKVQSGALQHLVKLPDVSSVHANPSQRPSAKSSDHTRHFPGSVSKSDKLHTLKTAQLRETMTSPIKATFQSEGSWKPFCSANTSSDDVSASDHTAVPHLEGTGRSTHMFTGQFMSSSHTHSVQTKGPPQSSRKDTANSDEFCSLAVICDVKSVKDLQQLQDKSIKSDGHCDSFHTAKDQQEDVIILPNTSADQSKENGDFSKVTPSETMKSCASKMAQTVQIEDRFDQQPTVMDDLTETRRAVSCNSKVPYQSLEAKAEWPQTTKATENYEDCIADPPRNLPTQFAGSFNAEQASTGNSEEIYLSCGSHWSDRVTANKVAVEGDLMASIIKVTRKKDTLLFCKFEVMAFRSSSNFNYEFL